MLDPMTLNSTLEYKSQEDKDFFCLVYYYIQIPSEMPGT